MLTGKARRLAIALLVLGACGWGARQYVRSYPVPFLASLMPEAWRHIGPGMARSEVYRACGSPTLPWGDIKGDVWSQPTALGSWQQSVFYVEGGPVVRETYVAYFIGNVEHYVQLHVRMTDRRS